MERSISEMTNMDQFDLKAQSLSDVEIKIASKMNEIVTNNKCRLYHVATCYKCK